jgi:geranyl-CoA carboxylase alpha subunit
MQAFKTILIANRGEIACRVIRTARTMGYASVAVHSDADADAPHVALADEAIAIGPAPAAQSYLDIGRILDAARQSGADAVHPGYGFLSENADFARACAEAGLTFIGPGAEAIELMGNKAAAKRRMIRAGVPCVPGHEDADQADGVLEAAAAEIGFPIMVKAAAGGGGRGMRLVHQAADLKAALAAARSEALNAFGSRELILERAVERPRHVEIQVFADTQGHVIHLGERDCSVQRRHQKVIEEAPSPAVDEELRRRMGEAAVEAARAIGYVGAGTVEFLLAEDGEFYFLEMNTRLQVEHPVTEMVTGLDLVALQIQVAEGLPLGHEQTDIRLRGHAIEARLYAEDPAAGFLPQTGTVRAWQPAEAEGLRIDAGIKAGQEITPFYDPMVAKVIAWGETREAARHKLIKGLEETELFGPITNQGFLIDILSAEKFATGGATTGFIDEIFQADDMAGPAAGLNEAAMAAAILFRAERGAAHAASVAVSDALLDWSSAGTLASHYMLETDAATFDLSVRPQGKNMYIVSRETENILIECQASEPGRARLRLDGRRREPRYDLPAPGRIDIALAGRTYAFSNKIALAGGAEAEIGSGRVTAPMHGTLLEVLVAPGDGVTVGTRLAVLEAMKMQHDIVAGIAGTVIAVHARVEAQAASGELLLEIEPASDECPAP